MEEHAVLRIPEELKASFDKEIDENGYPNCSFNFNESSNSTMLYRGKLYKISKISLPCILESQKTFDNNQFYKVSDISTMIVVWPIEFTDDEIEYYKKVYACSGITPPLKYVKYRRWRKRPSAPYKNEDVEKKVKELLRKDALASHVEIQKFTSEKNEEDDVSSIAAELEKDLRSSEDDEKQTEQINVEDNENTRYIKQQLKEIESKINEKKEFLKNSTNIIVKKRFEESIKSLELEYNNYKQKLE